MSGGTFNYIQIDLQDVAAQLEEFAATEKDLEIKQKLEEAAAATRIAAIKIQRADWYLSGDDGRDEYLLVKSTRD